MTSRMSYHWPVLRRFDQNHLRNIAMPLGGIGTGTVSIGGRGDLRDVELMSHPDKGAVPEHLFFLLRAKAKGSDPVVRNITGPVDDANYLHPHGFGSSNHRLPGFRKARFDVAYPLAQVSLSDPDVPLDVRIEAWNPLIPGDAAASSLPVAILRYVLINNGTQPIDAAVLANIPNIIGNPMGHGETLGTFNKFKKSKGARSIQGLFMQPGPIDPNDSRYGNMALATTATTGISYREYWHPRSWGTALLNLWNDFKDDGAIERDHSHWDTKKRPIASLAVRTRVMPGKEMPVTFLWTWHFPNRPTWSPRPAQSGSACCEGDACCPTPGRDPDMLTNHYTTRFKDAWETAKHVAKELPDLEKRTVTFVSDVTRSDIPDVFKERALANLSTLRSQTCFQTDDGIFWGYEGCNSNDGCCPGSCTHVWNYEFATHYLFGDLAQTMRQAEFLHATDDDGAMNFRIWLPLDRAQDHAVTAADGQMGCILKLYRQWRHTGDDDMLKTYWPHVKRALAFAWRNDGWDPDANGVMETCQHNTMDVEYFGPNPQCSVIYLAALRAGEELAKHLGDTEFAQTCRILFNKGSKWIDQHLFNGEYYHQVIDIAPTRHACHPKLHPDDEPKFAIDNPPAQVGDGCEVNQLLGEMWAQIDGLGNLLKTTQVKKSLRSILKYNFKKDFFGHFNFRRTYAINDEAGLLMCTFPRGGELEEVYPYGYEVWTGLEHTIAIHLVYLGMHKQAINLVQAVADRHDGKRRNPFDEFECGHHYARAMASWGLIPAITGFYYHATNKQLRFNAPDKAVTWFWSNGSAWGTCHIKPARNSARVQITVRHGELTFQTLELAGMGETKLPKPVTVKAGKSRSIQVAF